MKQPTVNKEHEKLYSKYLAALVRFYGRISLGDAFAIIQKQNKEKYDFLEFVIFARKEAEGKSKHQENGEFYILYQSEVFYGENDENPSAMEVINQCFLDLDEDYYELEAIADDYPFYIPQKQELLRYADDNYTKETPALRRLAEWVLRHQRKDLPFELAAEDVYSEAVMSSQMFSDYMLVLSQLSRWIDLSRSKQERDKQLDELINLLTEVHNTTRQWHLNGHTPKEIEALLKNHTLHDVESYYL